MIKFGASPFEGVLRQWYGWAGVETYEDSPDEDDSGSEQFEDYAEGPIRLFRLHAYIDGWLMSRKLRSKGVVQARSDAQD